MTSIYHKLREQFTDHDFGELSEDTRFRLKAAADFAEGVLREWPTTPDATRAARATKLEAMSAGLKSIIASNLADTLDTAFWRAIHDAAGETLYLAIRALL